MAASVGMAESANYPQMGFGAYGSHGRQFKFINGPDVNYSNVGAEVTIAMMLCDFGRTKAAIHEAQYALLAANWQSDWAIQKVIVKVLENAYSALHAQEALAAYRETLSDAEKMLHVSNELNRSGLRAVTDVYTSQATLAQVRMEVSQQQALLDIQKAKLASSLGFPADTHLEIASLGAVEVVEPEQVCCLIACAKAQRADLMAQHQRLGETRERLKKSNAEYYPKLSFRGRGGADHYFHDRSGPAYYDITLNIDIPLFNGFETVYKNRYAYTEVESSEEELAQMELDIALEVLTHARNLEAVQEMLVYARENLDNALKAHQGVMEKYQAGKDGIAELSNALRQLAVARVRFSDMRTRYLVTLANLAYATGTLTPRMEVAPCR